MRTVHSRTTNLRADVRPEALRQASVPWRCAVVVALSLLTGCGNLITTEINGAVAAKSDGSDSVLLVLRVCSGAVNQIQLYGPRTGPETQSQTPIGEWRAPIPLTQNTVLDVNDPGPVWEVRRDPGPLDPDTSYSVLADNLDLEADEQLTRLTFNLRGLESLRSGQVRFNGRVLQEAKFSRLAWCDRW